MMWGDTRRIRVWMSLLGNAWDLGRWSLTHIITLIVLLIGWRPSNHIYALFRMIWMYVKPRLRCHGHPTWLLNPCEISLMLTYWEFRYLTSDSTVSLKYGCRYFCFSMSDKVRCTLTILLPKLFSSKYSMKDFHLMFVIWRHKSAGETYPLVYRILGFSLTLAGGFFPPTCCKVFLNYEWRNLNTQTLN